MLATAPIGRSLTRVTFGGPEVPKVTAFGPDQRIKIFLPRAGEAVPLVPTGPDWYRRYRALPERQRPPMRTYTIRSTRPGELDVDFVRHGDLGPASRWAGRAVPGDKVVILAPNAGLAGRAEPRRMGADYLPPADSTWRLIAGDETALPAIGGIVESLAGGEHARVFVEIPVDADRQQWRTAGEVSVTWLPREGASDAPGAALLHAVRATELPEGRGYAWLAGEAFLVRDLRRHLIGERGMTRAQIDFCGYWRRGKSEDAAYEPDDD
ncbi:siderophore-interacting protein [Amycolatopsis minnesotensis]|uniref:Siderophore-interacting protein n=1 Tax=Amycolatopsis minnesotensis TaxID=337894 RepID=A0ABP5BYM8_9PSEU